MNWILGLIGAVFGAVIAGERSLFGALAGFLLVYLLAALGGLRSRLQRSENELGALKLRIAELSARTPSVAAASAATAEAERSEAAPSAIPVGPEPPADNALRPVAFRDLRAERESVQTEQGLSSTGTSEAFAAASAPTDSTPQSNQAAAAESAQAPPASPISSEPPRPGWDDKITAAIKRWFTEGNVPVKIGVLVLFAGVAAALRYAAVQGYFTMPIEVRLAVIAAGALIALGLGWRERVRRPAFGLSLQGGALGVLLLTIFAAYGKYGLLPPMAAFALVVVLVAGAAALAVLQDAIALGALGFLGGYLAPVLISTGSNNPIGLFSYYAVLNAAVFAVSWTRSWRLLNLIGFAFTFGVGTAWGTKFYRPELFSTIEPFLILFFVFYLAIGLLYVLRQSEHRRPWVDGTLVFGTPLLAFPLQAALLRDNRMALAFSALLVGVVYAGLVYWLRRKRDERLLTEAYGALALGFATLAVPLAFSAGTTASVWALEGAGAAWLGIRQNRTFPWLAGLALQLFAAGAYLQSVSDIGPYLGSSILLLNPDWLGGAILAFAGFALSLIHERHRPRFALPVLLFVWATFWLLLAGATQWDLAQQRVIGSWRFGMLYLAAIAAFVGWLRTSLEWPRLGSLLALVAGLGFLMVFVAANKYDAPLAMPTLGTWAVYAALLLWALWRTRGSKGRSPAIAHVFWLWTLALTTSMQLRHVAIVQQLAEGWGFLAQVAPLCLLTLALWRVSNWMAWPRAEDFVHYRNGWFGLALPLLVLFWLVGLFLAGDSAPIAYLPLLNPLELGLLAIAALVFAYVREEVSRMQSSLRLWPLLAFAFASMATLRGVHHLHGEPWGRVLDSGFTQTSLTVVWSLIGVSAWILGSRRLDRRLWWGGLVVMIAVLLKLVAVDRQYMGNMPGIVSFIAVGLLLVGVGYFAPSPPKRVEAEST
jgi:uncharacterized membrane protein